MHPSEENEENPVTPSLIEQIQYLHGTIRVAINEAGRLADWCSGDNGDKTEGVHGLQMSYDRLTEAKMWAGLALGELGNEA